MLTVLTRHVTNTVYESPIFDSATLLENKMIYVVFVIFVACCMVSVILGLFMVLVFFVECCPYDETKKGKPPSYYSLAIANNKFFGLLFAQTTLSNVVIFSTLAWMVSLYALNIYDMRILTIEADGTRQGVGYNISFSGGEHRQHTLRRKYNTFNIEEKASTPTGIRHNGNVPSVKLKDHTYHGTSTPRYKPPARKVGVNVGRRVHKTKRSRHTTHANTVGPSLPGNERDDKNVNVQREYYSGSVNMMTVSDQKNTSDCDAQGNCTSLNETSTTLCLVLDPESENCTMTYVDVQIERFEIVQLMYYITACYITLLGINIVYLCWYVHKINVNLITMNKYGNNYPSTVMKHRFARSEIAYGDEIKLGNIDNHNHFRDEEELIVTNNGDYDLDNESTTSIISLGIDEDRTAHNILSPTYNKKD